MRTAISRCSVHIAIAVVLIAAAGKACCAGQWEGTYIEAEWAHNIKFNYQIQDEGERTILIADEGAGDLSGEGDYRYGVEIGVGDTGHQIGSTGPGRSHADAHLAGSPGIAVGGMRGSLLVTHQDMPDLRVLRQGIVKRQKDTPREAEHDFDSLFYQAFT